MKIAYLIIALLLFIPTGMAYTQVQYSLDNITGWTDVAWTMQNSTVIETLNDGIQDDTTYYFRLRTVYEQGNSDWVYVSGKTKNATEERDMSSIAITMFILTVTLTLFILPFLKTFSKNVFVDTIFRRLCWVVAIYLMVLNSAIMSTIASDAGLNLTQEMFRYMWMFGWAGYTMMVFIVVKTIVDLLKMWKLRQEEFRFGDE